MIEIKLLIKKYFKHFLVLAGLCPAIWAYIYFVHGYTKYTYHNNGQIRTEIPYKGGKQHGVGKRYYTNGQISREISYVNGKKHGVRKSYYENGRLHYETTYANGKKHGTRKEYYENGKLKSKKPYKEGRRYGYGGYYDDKGKPIMPFYKPSSTKFDRYHFRTDLSRIFVAGYIWGENL
ncbi:toxin-antitoxin system YwqK family antitoxin [Helicobacter pullorum]|uniref:toxin-antitoxin system YwqK family antitoxin n=1 Tax=Helicobacter pullorum TaxID=35818 RepID=UPI00241E8DA1|nr:toxin-antitoxin system YwqK family antitoxin [Helicobacter pullorum]